MYLTVVKLYYKHEMDGQKQFTPSFTMMQSQFEYARDHIQQAAKVAGRDDSRGSGAYDDWPAMNTRAFKVRMFDAILSLGIFGAFIYWLYLDMKKMQSTN